MNQSRKILVAMSGGVDSSAAALLLRQQGYDVVGVAMQVWDYRNHSHNSARATCCAPADFDDARRISELGDFPFYVFDFEGSFDREVISPFVTAYQAGLTPNPCIECNRKIKFRELYRRAAMLGIDAVATGHYAQIKAVSEDELGLFTGRDLTKDQSYFLFMLTQEELGRTLFPVGGMHKREVRELLASEGAVIAEKDESQDICFVTGSVGDFVERYSGKKSVGGNIVSSQGEVLGHHGGVHNFTVGQRRGLGVAAANPLYVLQIDADSQLVTVGEKDELDTAEFFVHSLSSTRRDIFPESGEKEFCVKVRYRQQALPCLVSFVDDDLLKVRFTGELTAICPGQLAVFYSPDTDTDGDREVFGGGTIARNFAGNSTGVGR
ncbi:MAG: tRNA 2-thiouridine(34) synthase MnmA [bacterium]|nr:tRNA 2-thiouridine(34) synthase MnmA [bacterium]